MRHIRKADSLQLVAIGVLLAVAFPGLMNAQSTGFTRQVLVRDITTIAGIRDNPLVGYGLVVGLHGTGDSQQTIFTVQTLANAMQKMGVLIPPSVAGSVMVKNIAAVFITATLPPFSRPGERLDVTVSSIGDAHSLEGGVLLMSSLRGPDSKVYVEAQGPLIMGGYLAGSGTNGKQMNPTNVGMIPGGGIVERDTSVDIDSFKTVSLLLRNPDFATATEIAHAVNMEFNKPVATALDSGRVDINVAEASAPSVPVLIAQVQDLQIKAHTPAKIVINERTGTIVMGGDVKLSPVSVIHGNLSIQVVTSYTPVQPLGSAPGQQSPGAFLVPQTAINVNDGPAQSMRLEEGANVDELVNGLHAIGTSAHDVVAILQAIKAEGGMQADLEVQ
ncbi:MAG: flagellar basal body P-ring protein FlgI [Acidobacteriaceae bacterium]